jgi:citrate lyase subunit beta/citryl-CoA lyase
MDGKTCVHPSQIAICNAIFSPQAEELAWADKVCDAFSGDGGEGRAVLRLEGRMVERLHVDAARRTIALAEAIGLRGT